MNARGGNIKTHESGFDGLRLVNERAGLFQKYRKSAWAWFI
ncbi:hypothetical protein AmDm5_0747 [Acetobacter malorum]|nr:hypothetical protein AmDm5_0747 [Acetobacter malorum]